MVVAEEEGITNLCPHCSSVLTALSGPIDCTQPGTVAVSMNYSYCEHCKRYFLGGTAFLLGDEVGTHGN